MPVALSRRERKEEQRKINKHASNKTWQKANPEKYHESKKKSHKTWYKANLEKLRAISKAQYKTNLDKVRAKNKAWAKANPEKKKAFKAKRKRELGYTPMNEYFEGSDGHHIDKNNVIFIPKDLHKSIPHRQEKPKSMYKINLIAWDYLEASAY
jgi:hypothetical protein